MPDVPEGSGMEVEFHLTAEGGIGGLLGRGRLLREQKPPGPRVGKI